MSVKVLVKEHEFINDRSCSDIVSAHLSSEKRGDKFMLAKQWNGEGSASTASYVKLM